jgi:hypothetical protein
MSIVVAIYATFLFHAAADRESKLSNESLRSRFSEVRGLLSRQGTLKSFGPEKVIRTEFGTPTRRGVDLKSDDLDMTVDPVTGRILSIETKAATKQGNAPGMNEEQAEDMARSLVRKIGSKVDARMKVIHRGFDASTGRWKVAWERMIDGYSFPEETIFVSFNDSDWTIVSFRDRTTDQGCSTKPVIDEKTARAAAEGRITDLLPELFGEHYEIGNVTQGKLQIAYPNERYVQQDRSEGPGASETGPQPRLVYSFDLTFKYTGTATLRKTTPPMAVWVDALTGAVIGGL